MSTEDNKVLTRRGYDALNERNWAAFDALLALDMVFHNASTTTQGREPYKQFISRYFTAFPDACLTIEDIIAEGDNAVVRQTFQGTHKGDLMGIPPTGKQANTTGISIFRWANGKVVEQWSNYDDLGLMQQLGVIPAPEQAS
ncbi:MAG: ester cyclase [Ktedonobacteraceae bacterium]